MQRWISGLAACVMGMGAGCVGAVDGPQEGTDRTESAQRLPPGGWRGTTPWPFYGLITFDDVPSGTQITSHYPGVTFDKVLTDSTGTVVTPQSDPILVLPAFPPTPAVPCSNYIFAPPCPPSGNVPTFFTNEPAIEGSWGGIRATFASPKNSVSIMVRAIDYAYGTSTNQPFLEAFDANGAYIAGSKVRGDYGLTGGAAWGTWETLTVNVPSGTQIVSVIFSTDPFVNQPNSSAETWAEFDNLTYR